jgi:hypothetical protein
MRKWLDAYKPAAPASTHLLLASLMWTIVGAVLLGFGARWVLAGRTVQAWAILGIAVFLGLLKGRFVLRRTADRMIERIRARGDGRCLGGFLSLRSWALVAVMAGAGRLLRGGLTSRTVLGFLYAAVGSALLLAALRIWAAWYRHRSRT